MLHNLRKALELMDDLKDIIDVQDVEKYEEITSDISALRAKIYGELEWLEKALARERSVSDV